MIIRYFAYLRDFSRVSEQRWTEPAGRLGDLLETLCCRYGPGFRRWLLEEDGRLGQMSIVLINGRDARELAGLDTPLQSDDVIALFPPVAGGCTPQDRVSTGGIPCKP
jgi:molybdopterin synthase sulfur carrier subunit